MFAVFAGAAAASAVSGRSAVAGTTVAAPTVVTNERLVTLSMMVSTCCHPNILHWIVRLTCTRLLSYDRKSFFGPTRRNDLKPASAIAQSVHRASFAENAPTGSTWR